MQNLKPELIEARVIPTHNAARWRHTQRQAQPTFSHLTYKNIYLVICTNKWQRNSWNTETKYISEKKEEVKFIDFSLFLGRGLEFLLTAIYE